MTRDAHTPGHTYRFTPKAAGQITDCVNGYTYKNVSLTFLNIFIYSFWAAERKEMTLHLPLRVTPPLL